MFNKTKMNSFQSSEFSPVSVLGSFPGILPGHERKKYLMEGCKGGQKLHLPITKFGI